jgi:hypothetical protein
VKQPKIQFQANRIFAASSAVLVFATVAAGTCFAADNQNDGTFTLSNGMYVQSLKKQTSSKTSTLGAQPVVSFASSSKNVGMPQAPAAYIGEVGSEFGAVGVMREVVDQKDNHTDLEKSQKIWDELLHEMAERTRDFTPEESKAHQQALDSIFEVEREVHWD